MIYKSELARIVRRIDPENDHIFRWFYYYLGTVDSIVTLIISNHTSIDRTHQAASNDIQIIIGTHSQANRQRKENYFNYITTS